MGCAGSKKRALRLREGKADEPDTQQSAVRTRRRVGKPVSLNSAACSSQICTEEGGSSDDKALSMKPHYGHRFAHGVLELSAVKLGLSPLPPDAATAASGDGTPRKPLATSSPDLSQPSPSAAPRPMQLTSSRTGVKDGVFAGKASATDEACHCNERSSLSPWTVDDTLPFAAPHSTVPPGLLCSSSPPPLRLFSPVACASDLADQPSAASLQSPSDTHTAALRELRRGGSVNVDSSVLMWALRDTAAMGTSLLQRVNSAQPPLQAGRSSSYQLVAPFLVQKPSPLPPSAPAAMVETAAAQTEPVSATQLSPALTAKAQRSLPLASPACLSNGDSPVACGDGNAIPKGAIGVVEPIDVTTGTLVPLCSRSGSDAEASSYDGARGGRGERTSGGNSTTRSAQPPAVVAAPRRHSPSASSLPFAGRQQRLTVALVSSFKPPHDSISLSLRTPAQRQTSPCKSEPTTPALINITASGSRDAPEDVPLPQCMDLFGTLQPSSAASTSDVVSVSNGGDGVEGILTPRSHMSNSADTCGTVAHTHNTNLHAASSVTVTTGTVTLTQPNTPRMDVGSSNAHYFVSGSNNWLLGSIRSTDGDRAGFVVGSRRCGGNLLSTPPPTNSEIVQQIRQPTMKVKSILRKPGGIPTVAYGTTVVKDGDRANTNHAHVLQLSVNGGEVGGGAEMDANSTPRMLDNSGTAGSGDERALGTPSSASQMGLQTDFIVLRHTASDSDYVSSVTTTADALSSPAGSRSLMHCGTQKGTWFQASPHTSESAANNSVSGVLRTSIENDCGFLSGAVHGPGNVGTDGTSPSAVVYRSLASPCRLPWSLSTPRKLSPYGAQQRCSNSIDSGGGANVGNVSSGGTQEPPQSTVTELSTLFTPDAVVAVGRTPNEPPPDIILASPPPKRVHVVV
ncbi:hypothetical protein LPMP_170480 [Leishmania panamensis]|uniref:Uncharacterized protein n=1 Tax=Leishmania panamensis TaxID=5679 RepID=A0A088S6A0_LEIPA|nr:hypothetical protein LPMP_170480 [Leishmania panamensis]AIN97086.1 hypothetical protein LPMP_170480 [Leishmania panamensis]